MPAHLYVSRSLTIMLGICALLTGVNLALAEAVITSVSDPTPPGKLCVIVGDGWAAKGAEVRASRVADAEPGEPASPPAALTPASWQPAPVLRQEPQVLTCQLPTGDFGVFAVEVRGADQQWSRPCVINRTRAEWLSVERAAPNDVVRVFGRCLIPLSLYPEWDKQGVPVSYGGYVAANPRVVLRSSQGKLANAKILKTSSYDVHFRLPDQLAPGRYQVFVHNGLGGAAGWSDPLELAVGAAPLWPQEIFDVRRCGAAGDGVADDTAAIQSALQQADANHGGVVYFPPGSYLVKATLHVPKQVVLRGKSRERSWIFLADGVDHGKREEGLAIPVGIAGETEFGIEKLTIHGVYSRLLVAAPLKKELSPKLRGWPDMLRLEGPEAEDVFIRDCRIYHEPTYKYHTREDEPFLSQQRLDRESPWGVFSAVALRGKNLTVTENSIKGAGMPVAFVSSRQVNFARNELFAGTQANGFTSHGGNYPTTAVPDRCIFEDNVVLPSSNECHSGFWAHAAATRFYFARNRFRMFWVCDVEGILFHGFGRQMVLDVNRCEGNSLGVSGAGRWRRDNKDGQADLADDSGQLVPGKFKNWQCLVVQGRGLSQTRMVVDNTATTVTLDRPWDPTPDEHSRVALMSYPVFRQLIVVDNVLEDVGPGVYIWGDGSDSVIDGNRMSRAGGVCLSQVDLPYREWSGNFSIQVLHNVVREGRYYGVPISWTAGLSGTEGYNNLKRGIGQLGLVFRGNLHQDDTAVALRPGRAAWPAPPSDVGLVLEDNRSVDCAVGIQIGAGVSATLRGNQFQQVDRELIDLEQAK